MMYQNGEKHFKNVVANAACLTVLGHYALKGLILPSSVSSLPKFHEKIVPLPKFHKLN